MKRTIKVILFAILVGIVALIIVSNVSKHRTLHTVLTSDEEIENAVLSAVLDHKRVLKFESTVAPDKAISDRIFYKAVARDPYAASDFYGYWSSYEINGGT